MRQPLIADLEIAIASPSFASLLDTYASLGPTQSITERKYQSQNLFVRPSVRLSDFLRIQEILLFFLFPGTLCIQQGSQGILPLLLFPYTFRILAFFCDDVIWKKFDLKPFLLQTFHVAIFPCLPLLTFQRSSSKFLKILEGSKFLMALTLVKTGVVTKLTAGDPQNLI